MIADRRTTTRGGDPQLTVVVTGAHDVYRFAHHLERGQCEFAAVGQRTRRYLKRITLLIRLVALVLTIRELRRG